MPNFFVFIHLISFPLSGIKYLPVNSLLVVAELKEILNHVVYTEVPFA